MWTVWLYRFKPGLTAGTVDALRLRGAERVHPGTQPEGGTFLGRLWGHLAYTHASVLQRDGLAGVRAEVADVDELLRTLRVLSPALAGLEVRNLIPRGDEDLARLGDDGWHAQAVQPWVDAAAASDEVAHHLDVIGMSCLQHGTVPPYTVQSVWRARRGFPQRWIGGRDPRAGWAT